MEHHKDQLVDGSVRELASLAKSLSHPVRVTILKKLASVKGCSCGDFVKELPLAQATVSQHLAVLVTSKLVTRTQQGPMSCYAVNREAIHRLSQIVGKFVLEMEKEVNQNTCC